MKMLNIKLNFNFLVFFSLLLILGCKKFVQVPPPQNQLSAGSVFKEKYTAIAAITSMYGSMARQMFSYSLSTGFSADEFICYSGVSRDINLYKNSLIEKDGNGFFWADDYKYIFQANAAIEGLQNAGNGITPDIRNQLLGEAKFIRAFWYFYLVNLYNDVPYTVSTDYSQIIRLPRESRLVIYERIIADLKDAQNLLGNDYVDSKNEVSIDRVRPTKWVAKALLSRVYLFTKDYKNALQQSTELIENKNTFHLEDDLNKVFLKNSSEAIWQLMPVNNDTRTWEGRGFILTAAPTSVAISPQLLQAFEPEDLRIINWISSITVSGKTYYFPFKYKVKNNGSLATEYTMIFRLTEQFLIRAEAKVHLDDLEGSTADLNIIRHRAGLEETEAISKADLIKAILHERQVELFSEGHRWMDLKESGKIDEVMSVVTPEKGGGKWQSYQQWYPISPDDINRSKNLKQNTGY